ncbi:MAG: hypothetical protein LBT16_12145 [Treponema sp.]|nr:hypothetical protein [Treponema sp.]
MVLFFSVFFILSFLIVSGIRYLLLWIEAVSTIPPVPFARGGALVSAFKYTLSVALYFGILFPLSYSVRRKMPAGASIMVIFLLSCVFTIGVSLGLRRAQVIEAQTVPASWPALGEAGLRLGSGDVTIVVLGDPNDTATPRVAAIPGRPLVFQDPGARGHGPPLPPAPFFKSRAVFMNSLNLDFNIVSERLFALLEANIFQFSTYAASIIFFLVSCRFVFELSSWPFANVFLGFLVFRGILAFQVFLDSEQIQNLILFFIGRLIPRDLISPMIYLFLGLLVIIYTALTNVARGGKRYS